MVRVILIALKVSICIQFWHKRNAMRCKGLAVFAFLEIEMRLNEAETEKFNIKQMKDMFEQKAAQLATEIVGKI